MSETLTNDDERLEELRESLEELRARIMDLDAMAHAAAETLPHLPFLPRPSRAPQPSDQPVWTEEETRNLGRMQSLVFATAEAAERALDEINELIEQTYSERGPGGGSSGASGGAQGASNDEPSGATGGADSAPGGTIGSSRGQSSASRAGAPAGEQPRDPGLRSLPGGILLDMRPIPPRI